VKYVKICNVIPVQLKVQNMCNTLNGSQPANLKITMDWYQLWRFTCGKSSTYVCHLAWKTKKTAGTILVASANGLVQHPAMNSSFSKEGIYWQLS